MDEEIFKPPILEITRETEKVQVKKLKALRKKRNNAQVRKTLLALKKAASGKANLMPFLIDCAKAYATMGEIADALREEFGEYIPPSVI